MSFKIDKQTLDDLAIFGIFSTGPVRGVVRKFLKRCFCIPYRMQTRLMREVT